MPLRKRVARLLRTSANRLDPPKPTTVTMYTTNTLGSISIKGTPGFYMTNRLGI